jgi:hypothetical protein
MTEAKKKAAERRFEVMVSFDGLNKGDVFTSALDTWTQQHLESGYLRDVTQEPTTEETHNVRGEVGQG